MTERKRQHFVRYPAQSRLFLTLADGCGRSRLSRTPRFRFADVNRPNDSNRVVGPREPWQNLPAPIQRLRRGARSLRQASTFPTWQNDGIAEARYMLHPSRRLANTFVYSRIGAGEGNSPF